MELFSRLFYLSTHLTQLRFSVVVYALKDIFISKQSNTITKDNIVKCNLQAIKIICTLFYIILLKKTHCNPIIILNR